MLACLVVGVVVASGCGTQPTSERGTDGLAPPAVEEFPEDLGTVPPILSKGGNDRAAPRWEPVEVFSGTGPLSTRQFSIQKDAIQWRVKWKCEAGSLRITTKPPKQKNPALVEGTCPNTGDGYSVQSGAVSLGIEADGPWTATVEQQVDTPIRESPLPGMEPANILSKGDFYNVDKQGKGTVTLYKLPTGERALRLSEDFEVSNDPDLAVWLSEVPHPNTSVEAQNSPHVQIAALKATRGPQNYIVPPEIPTEKIRSVVLWCVPVPSAYAIASLA